MDCNGNYICLIGGGGFLGTALRKAFSAAGYSVITMGRSRTIPLVAGERYFCIQESTYGQLTQTLAGISFLAVLDLAYATVPGTSYLDPVADFSDNLRNVIHHLNFVRTLRTEKYLYVSSGGTVYGDATGQHPFKETDPTVPLSPYGITKLACERYVLMYQQLYGVPGLILRPSNIYGPGQQPFRGQGLIATALGLALRGQPVIIYGSGTTVRDYLYVTDFCAAVIALCTQGVVGQIYNVGSATGVSITGLMDRLEEVLRPDQYQLTRTHQPARPFDVLFSVLDTTKLKNAVNWIPQVDLAEGLRRTWQWMQSQPSTIG